MSAKSFFERLSSQAPKRTVVHGALSGCACNSSAAGGYTWQPRRCALESFTRESACALLAERGIRQIVLVGDSITIQVRVRVRVRVALTLNLTLSLSLTLALTPTPPPSCTLRS